MALISFGASAWKLAQRERFIGWQEPQRLKNLQLVVNNARFLILPWIESKGLASKILFWAARRLPEDWLARYEFRPVLLETNARVRASPRNLLQGRQLDQHWTDHRARKKIFQPPATYPRQGYLAIPTTQELRQRAVLVAGYGFTECLRIARPKSAST